MARIKGPRKDRPYGAEFKLKAVKLSELLGVRVLDVAEALDIHPFILTRRQEARSAFRKTRVSLSFPFVTVNPAGSTPSGSGMIFS